MGYTTRTYAVYGVRVDSYDNEFSDLYQEYDEIAARGDLPFVLFDCMSGQYMTLGVCLYVGAGSRWPDQYGDELMYLPKLQGLKDLRKKYVKEFKTIFPDYVKYISNPLLWRTMIFEHTV